MNALRFTLGLFAGLVILAGCSGSQPPIGTPGAMPQGGVCQCSPGAADRAADSGRPRE